MAKASDNVFPKIIGAEQGSNPAAPAAGQRKLYPKSDGWYDEDSSGTVTGPLGVVGGAATFVGCKATRTTNQALPAATVTAIQFDAADEYDTSSIHDPASNNTRLTVPTGKDGVWRFTASLAFAAGTGTRRSILWSKNGVQLNASHGGIRAVVDTASAFLTTSLDIQLAAGDYIEVLGESAPALNVTAATVACQFLG